MADLGERGRPLTVGLLLSQSFEVFLAESGRLLPIAIAFSAVTELVALALDRNAVTSSFYALLIQFGIGLTTSLLFQSALIYLCFHTAIRLPATLAEGVAVAFDRFWPCLGLSLLFSAMFIIGFALLVVPGIIVMIMFLVSFPAVVIGNAGVLESLRRSRALTKGHRWMLLGVLVIYILVAAALAAAILYGTIWYGMANVHSVAPMALPSLIVLRLVSAMIWGTVGFFAIVLNAVTYERLRAFRTMAAP